MVHKTRKFVEKNLNVLICLARMIFQSCLESITFLQLIQSFWLIKIIFDKKRYLFWMLSWLICQNPFYETRIRIFCLNEQNKKEIGRQNDLFSLTILWIYWRFVLVTKVPDLNSCHWIKLSTRQDGTDSWFSIKEICLHDD